VTINRASKRGESYSSSFGTIPLIDVANAERPLPENFISKDGLFVTKAFLDYANPLIGELPKFFDLNLAKAKP
jgi:ATP-dependent phosphofructokinase / diphosphate-dependent phosphofructokinase